MTFRDDVLAYLQRNEYPYMGATTDDLPDGVDVSYWDDNFQVTVWMTILDSPDPVVGDQACERLYLAACEASDPHAEDWNVWGVICLPEFTGQYDDIAESADYRFLDILTFDAASGLVPVPYVNEDDEDDDLSAL